ncbi:hypothetical protein G7B40_030640 [Aetokthonos hydrillicola Thurmond2011]|jgi:hypothetical protein|uniref:Uncharacterized protein n=1 Tax=Aetokthonos hydrillicola Thurmond2011 TaxID=2712845 RepID=A0AAP5IC34_9CYAN|nr:hypothetical protein [Aetokthonos hydrillicola]MBO3464037.1 hypothetical protein [Aetokthonos hydrillicola CCALA 1050]MBW4583922.1 hypothetical protein [Aetokthonos hydrillicola CCALA 1050]MDR9898882.1 hypothetical protein [Aetokthonos hydrillicola Thurmond2011]
MRKPKFVSLAGMALVASVAFAPLMTAKPAQAESKCSGTGVYLVTTDNGAGPQFTFKVAPDESVTGFFSNNLTPDQGVYSCRGNQFKFRSIEFSLADQNTGTPASIIRIDGNFEYDPGEKTISGTYEVKLFPLYSNPFEDGGPVLLKRAFTGVRIPVR